MTALAGSPRPARLIPVALVLMTIVGCGEKAKVAARKPASAMTPAQPAAIVGPTEPPAVPDRVLWRPTFRTTKGTVRAGTAFVVDLPDSSRPIVLTAIHVIGTGGGLPVDIPAAELRRAVQGVELVNLFDRTDSVEIGKDALNLPDAAPFGKPSRAGDIAAFRLPATFLLPTLRLSDGMPPTNARVWLAAQVADGAPKDRRLHPARSVGIGDEGLYAYEFDDRGLNLRATSGSPVLNSAGEVVALHLASSDPSSGKLTGFGNPVTRFRVLLYSAAKDNAPE